MSQQFCMDGSHETAKSGSISHFVRNVRNIEPWDYAPLLNGECPKCGTTLVVRLDAEDLNDPVVQNDPEILRLVECVIASENEDSPGNCPGCSQIICCCDVEHQGGFYG